MNAEEQLAYEARVRDRQSVIAAVAAVLFVVGVVFEQIGPQAKVAELTLRLITENKRGVYDIVGGVANGLSFVALALTIRYLIGSARARNPERVQGWVAPLALIGGTLSAVTTIVFPIIETIKAHQFVNTGTQTYQQANALFGSTEIEVVQIVALLGILLLAVSWVMVSLNAMQQGLLTRPMGYIGVIAGILTVFPLVQVPIVQAGWLAALAYLFSGRWPSGLPPAWSTGRSEPWPPASQARAQQAAARNAARGGAKAAPTPTSQPQPAGAGAPARTRASTSKRKRKRRN